VASCGRLLTQQTLSKVLRRALRFNRWRSIPVEFAKETTAYSTIEKFSVE